VEPPASLVVAVASCNTYANATTSISSSPIEPAEVYRFLAACRGLTMSSHNSPSVHDGGERDS
jgi:hypothetical protein